MSVKDSGFYSGDAGKKNLDQIEHQLDVLSAKIDDRVEEADLVYYNETDQKIQAIGGEAIHSLRYYEKKFLDVTRLSTFIKSSLLTNAIQKVMGLFYPSNQDLKTIAEALKETLKSVVSQASEAAERADKKETLQALKDRVELIQGKLNSKKVQKVLYSGAEAATEIEAWPNLTLVTDAIMKELKLAKMLSPERLKNLDLIAEKGGSLQANDVPTYEEYSALKNIAQKYIGEPDQLTAVEKSIVENLLRKGTTGGFEQALESLNKKTAELASKYPDLGDANVQEKVKQDLNEFKEIDDQIDHLKEQKRLGHLSESDYESKIKDLEKRKEQLRPTLDMIVAAKNFMRLVMSEEGEGSWINVFSFAKSGDPAFATLARIEAISHHQSRQLDELINHALFQEHLANKPGGEAKSLRAVVEGAGPNGLYSALVHFLAGADVTVVNDRGEGYVRNQILDLDPKWATQLRYFLGTKFDELFIGKDALGIFNEERRYIQINTKNLEDALKERLSEIASHASKHSEGVIIRKSPLKLHYEATFKDVVFPTEEFPRFTAALEPPTRPSAEALRFNQVLFDSKVAKILSERYRRERLEGTSTLPEKEHLEIAKAQAKEELIQDKTENVLRFLSLKYERSVSADEPLIDFTDESKQAENSRQKSRQRLKLKARFPS